MPIIWQGFFTKYSMRRFVGFAVLLLGHSYLTNAQVKDTVNQYSLKEFVFSASKFREKQENIAQKINIIKSKEIAWQMPQTSAAMLEQSGNVFVQRSQMGGGSPNIRGFEASRVLLIVDGVRMNNAIYRAGHLQNVITIDNNILDRVEVLYGPGSTLHGSDALGGVMVFTTKNPMLSRKKGAQFSGNVMTRYSSANDEGTAHFDLNIGTKKLASLTSVTYSSFGDLRQGDNRNPFYGDFGLRANYVGRLNGVDVVLPNTDPNVQKYTGYQQVDVLQKLLYAPKDNIQHLLNLQYSNSSDVPRYDRLTEVRNGLPRYAEWYYGPQERLLGAYSFSANELSGIIDEVQAGVNYQLIEESRYQRNFGSVDRRHRKEQLNIIGYNIDARKKIQHHELTIGTDGQFNDVVSTAYTEDINTNSRTGLDTRYPDGGSKAYYCALYAQDVFKVIPEKLVLNGGVRLNYVNISSEFKDTTFFPFPFKTATQEQLAWSGNLGMIYFPHKHWRMVLNGSSGFRSPNVDDMSKVFESVGGVSLVVPNPSLEPEYTYNVDLTLAYKRKRVSVEVTGFYTWFRNAIVQDFFTLNGQDSIVYNGQKTAIVASQNKARAYLYGVNATLNARLSSHLSFLSTINYTYGRYYNGNTEVPLDHIPPVYGKTSIMYDYKRVKGECYVMYNGWKRLSDYSPSGEDNQKYATIHGMPSWYTLNVRAGYQLHANVRLQLALENILDKNYRVFASGVSAPGRNLVITARANF